MQFGKYRTLSIEEWAAAILRLFSGDSSWEEKLRAFTSQSRFGNHSWRMTAAGGEIGLTLQARIGIPPARLEWTRAQLWELNAEKSFHEGGQQVVRAELDDESNELVLTTTHATTAEAMTLTTVHEIANRIKRAIPDTHARLEPQSVE